MKTSSTSESSDRPLFNVYQSLSEITQMPGVQKFQHYGFFFPLKKKKNPPKPGNRLISGHLKELCCEKLEGRKSTEVVSG